MKKVLLVSLILLLLSGCQKEKACNVNEGMICLNEETNHFIIEDNAKVTVAVDSEEYGQALQALWDKQFPEHMGVIEYLVQDSFDGKTFLNNNPDLGLVYSNEAARLDGWFLEINGVVKEDIIGTLVSQYGECVNQNSFVYAPMFGYGWVFSYNETMLKEVGVDMSDVNNDGLIDALDSFEKIDEWIKTLNNELIYREEAIPTVFQYNWNDPYQMMMLLTLADFRPFSTYLAEEPGWNSEQFLSALTDLSDLGKMQWSFYEKEIEILEDVDRQQSSSWGAEFYLAENQSIFSLVGTWMYYDEYESLNEENYRFSKMPSFNGATMQPYTLSAGYVINKNTEYPNACFEVMRLIRSDEGLQAYATVSNNPLLYNYNEERFELVENEKGKMEEIPLEALSLEFKNENLSEISFAMMQGREESMVSYALEPSVRGWTMIKECEIYSILEKVFNQTKTPVEAQNEIVEKTNDWMIPYLPVIEEETE